jgi:uncharacterized ParB-like nuclease family protein
MNPERKKYEQGLSTDKPFTSSVLGSRIKVRAHPALSPQQFAEQVHPREGGQTWDEVVETHKSKDPEAFNSLVESVSKEGIQEPVQVSARVFKSGNPFMYNGHHRVAAAIHANVDIPYVRVVKKEDDPFITFD